MRRPMVMVNRAPVLTRWAGVVAERLGYEEGAALSLARAFTPQELAAKAFSLYERFRPAIPAGVQGWGAKGELRLDLVRSLGQ